MGNNSPVTVELYLSASGPIRVTMTREEYSKIEDEIDSSGSVSADDIPNLDWDDVINTIHFEADSCSITSSPDDDDEEEDEEVDEDEDEDDEDDPDDVLNDPNDPKEG